MKNARSQEPQMAIVFYQNLAIAFIICAALILLYFKWCYKYWERKKIPYITPKIPYGNLENPLNLKIGDGIRLANIYAEFKRNGWKQGGIYSAMRPVYVPIDLDYVKNVLAKDFQYFADRGLYHNEKTDPLTANLFRLGGQKWKNLRKKFTPVFTSGKMKAMFSTVLDCGEQMKQALEETYLENKTFDIKEIAGCFTTDVIGSCAFGLECNSFKDPSCEFRKFARKVFGPNLNMMVRIFVTMSFPNICTRLGVKLLASDVTTFFNNVIKDVIEYRQSKAVERNDFVQILLEMKRSVESLTFEEMSAQAFVFFVAGFETSSSAMAFCLYELAKNPEIQEKVRREIGEVASKYEGGISYDSIQEMTYITQVIEGGERTLRMYPTLLILNRICTEDYILPDSDAVLKKGTPVFVSVYGIHHDPEYYPEPERFDPERFSPEARVKRPSFAFLPFGEGPRICIGLRFGMMQVKIGLATLLKHYQFRLNPKTPQTLTIDPKTPLTASVESILLDVKKI